MIKLEDVCDIEFDHYNGFAHDDPGYVWSARHVKEDRELTDDELDYLQDKYAEELYALWYNACW